VLDTSHVGLYTAPSGARVKIGIEGQPDLVVIYRGRAGGIELKSKDGRRGKKQEECFDAWGSNGTTIWLLRENDWDKLGSIIAWYEFCEEKAGEEP
jgi:hypothetical protein